MAYGTVQSRGVLGDPSAQARGQRTPKTEGAKGMKQRREEKPMKDVPLRKWKDHKNTLQAMDKQLKEAKKKWMKMDKNDPLRQQEIDKWRDGLQSRQETAAQFQIQRNVAQQAFEASVEEMKGLEGSDVYAGEKGGLFNKKYSTAAEEYRQLRNGGNIELGDWELGKDPVFNTRAQKINSAPQPEKNPDGSPKLDENGQPIVQYELDGYDQPQTNVTLDASNWYMGTQNFKFTGRSFADIHGKTTEFEGTAADHGIQSQSEIKGGAADRGGTEGDVVDPTMLNIGSNQLGSTGYMLDMLNKFDGSGAPGAIGQAASARGYNVVQNADGGTTRSKRKRYDLDGNRIE